MGSVADDRDDLIDRRRVSRVALTLVPGRPPGVKLRQRRRRAATAGSIELDLGSDATALVLAAEPIVREQQRTGLDATWRHRARDLTVDFDLTPLFAASDMLDDAWSVRLARFADALSAALAASAAAQDELAAADAAIRRHVRAAAEGNVLASLTAISRLVRWIHRTPSPPAATLSAAVRDEVRDGGWVARARAEITSSGAPELTGAARALATAVDAARSGAAIAFAAAAVRWDGEPSDELIGVEHVLGRVVAPVARTTPTLVVVLDGLSLAVLRGLLSDLYRDGWIERRPAAMTERPAALAVLPSLTTLSRSSLLSGRLASGGQADEFAGFAAHAGLREAGIAGGVPLLLHKRELSDDGATLSTNVRDEIFGKRRVVGLVINAIDDELSGAVQRHGHWSLRDIPLLDATLNAARDAGRAVILLSDHGHVPERMQTHRVAKGSGTGDRYRPADRDAPGVGEVLAEGRRVLGAPVTAPAAEPGWVQLLLVNDVFRQRRERAGRGAPSEDRVRALLSALGRHDGRLSPAALAAAAGVPAGRLDGLLAALRPLINLDGYPILTLDRDAELVELRIADLLRQFAI